MVERYNTGNPRPSNSMKDLSDNAQAYDDFMNSENDTFIDRLENEKDTLAGAQKKMAAAAEASVQDARQNLIPLSRQYMTLAAAQADIANIPAGSATYYRSPDDSALAIEVINNSGTLEPTGRKMPSQASLDLVPASVNKSIERESAKRRLGDFQELVAFKSLDEVALTLPENSALEFLSLATTTDVNTNFYRLVFSSLGSEIASLVFPGTNTQYSDGKFWSAYRLFRFQDLKYVSILETTSSVDLVRYDLPAGFGGPVAGSNYIALILQASFIQRRQAQFTPSQGSQYPGQQLPMPFSSWLPSLN